MTGVHEPEFTNIIKMLKQYLAVACEKTKVEVIYKQDIFDVELGPDTQEFDIHENILVYNSWDRDHTHDIIKNLLQNISEKQFAVHHRK